MDILRYHYIKKIQLNHSNTAYTWTDTHMNIESHIYLNLSDTKDIIIKNALPSSNNVE